MKSILIAALLLCTASLAYASSLAPTPDTLIHQEAHISTRCCLLTYRTGDLIGLSVATPFGLRRRYAQSRNRFVKLEGGYLYVCRASWANYQALEASREPKRMRAIPVRMVKAVVENHDDWELTIFTESEILDTVLCILFPILIPFAICIAIGKSIGHLFVRKNIRYPVENIFGERSTTETN